jgi:hypothetical protein
MNRLINAKQLIPYFNTIAKNEKSPHVYILHEREFLTRGEQTYKIGETEKPHRRFYNYPKSSQLVYIKAVKNSRLIEDIAKKRFKQIFKHKKEYGIEYFNGDLNQMIKEIEMIVCQCMLTNSIKPGLFFVLQKILKPLPLKPKRFNFNRKLPTLPNAQITHIGNNILPAEMQNSFKCQWCNKTFSTKRWLEYHQFETNVPCHKKCRICGEQCVNAKRYKLHILTHKLPTLPNAQITNIGTSILPAVTTKCQWCNKTFSTIYWLDHHQLETKVPCHKKCRICGQKCANTKRYKLHILTHGNKEVSVIYDLTSNSV